MKVENMIKLKEEFDYNSLSRRLDIELDKLIMEHERQQKAFEDEIERLAIEAQHRISEAERNYADSLEVGSISIFYINVICVVVCVNDFL
jgi:kinesin family protein 5